MSQRSYHYTIVHEERRLWAFDKPGQSAKCKRISRRCKRHHDKQEFLESLRDSQENYLEGEFLTNLLEDRLQDIQGHHREGISAIQEAMERAELS